MVRSGCSGAHSEAVLRPTQAHGMHARILPVQAMCVPAISHEYHAISRAGYEYLGCFRDNGALIGGRRLAPVLLARADLSLTLESCAQLASGAHLSFFATQVGVGSGISLPLPVALWMARVANGSLIVSAMLPPSVQCCSCQCNAAPVSVMLSPSACNRQLTRGLTAVPNTGARFLRPHSSSPFLQPHQGIC